MINPSFFPSRRLAFYMVRLFVTRSLAALIALVLILMTLDLLGESGKILAVPGNTDADLWRYVGLRLPILFARFLPFSVLLGTLIAFVGLNQNSEVVAMKAAGLSAHQILAPLVHLRDVIGFVRSHHERWDGSGYPDRLAGEAIPLGARIIGAVEIYDALTTSRPVGSSSWFDCIMCESAASVVSVRSRRSANRSRPELKSEWAGRTGWRPR